MSQGQTDPLIRRAVIGDIKPVHKLLSYYAGQGLLLPRSLSELYDHLRDYWVVEDASGDHPILGVCALGICWEDLAEIRSLAVMESQQKENLGTRLVKTCVEEARSLGVKRVFTLSYVPGFFMRLGFTKVDKGSLPHKIWADCLKCSKFPDCDETAMVMDL